MNESQTELDQLLRETPDEEHDESGEEQHAPRRRRGRIKTKEKGAGELNLTAMMDMMTIILVFLLKNYASTPENVTISDELGPPRSTAKVPMDVAVTVTVTKNGILVDDKPVVELNNGAIAGESAESSGPNAPITALAERLDRKVADANALAAKGGAPFEGKILIVADEATSYALLMRVLYTAGIAQFSQYKLVVRSMNAEPAGH